MKTTTFRVWAFWWEYRLRTFVFDKSVLEVWQVCLAGCRQDLCQVLSTGIGMRWRAQYAVSVYPDPWWVLLRWLLPVHLFSYFFTLLHSIVFNGSAKTHHFSNIALNFISNLLPSKKYYTVCMCVVSCVHPMTSISFYIKDLCLLLLDLKTTINLAEWSSAILKKICSRE